MPVWDKGGWSCEKATAIAFTYTLSCPPVVCKVSGVFYEMSMAAHPHICSGIMSPVEMDANMAAGHMLCRPLLAGN